MNIIWLSVFKRAKCMVLSEQKENGGSENLIEKRGLGRKAFQAEGTSGTKTDMDT